MWSKSYSVVTNEVSKEQLWKLFANVNQWHQWDTGIEYARMQGDFVEGNRFELKPKNGPRIVIRLVEVVTNQRFKDLTVFPLAKMYGLHEMEETPQGLKLTTTMTVTGPLGFLWRRLVAQDIVNKLPAEIQNQLNTARNL